MGDVHETVTSLFQGSRYVVSVRSQQQERLLVDVELEADASMWRGEFTNKYISEITSKTGNFKPYAVFVKMLISALQQTSDSVCIDLLTYSDLEVLKAKRLRRAGHDVPRPAQTSATSNKRYLILTYHGEFDKVHYPLPLAFEEYPDPVALKRVITNLRAQLANAPPDQTPDIQRLTEANNSLSDEVAILRQQATVAASTASAAAAADSSYLAAELDELRLDNAALEERAAAAEAEAQEVRVAGRREVRAKAREVATLREELAAARAQLREMRVKNRELHAEADRQQQRNRDFGPQARGRQPSRQARSTTPAARQRPPPRAPAQARARSSSPYASSLPRPGHTRPDRSRTGSVRSSAASDSSYGSAPRSRAHATHSAPSRSASALARLPRFDPTEYVRQKQQREAAVHARTRHTFSPASSRPPSAHSSPRFEIPRRPASAEPRTRTRSPAQARGDRTPTGRLRSTSARVPRTLAPQAPARSQRSPGGPNGSAAGRSESARRRLGSGANDVRAESPGRALQQVKTKLAEYQRSRNSGRTRPEWVDPVASRPERCMNEQEEQTWSRKCENQSPNGDAEAKPHMVHEGKAGYGAASSEIADIDTRLQALQDFLRSAKAAG